MQFNTLADGLAGMAVGLGGMFVPPTSAWYPLLHNIYLYGGHLPYNCSYGEKNQ